MNQKDIEIIEMISSRPGMFHINKIEDINILLVGYSLSGENRVFFFLNEKFSLFLKEYLNFNENAEWVKIIRFKSTNDLHSIELFKKYFSIFKEKIDGYNSQ